MVGENDKSLVGENDKTLFRQAHPVAMVLYIDEEGNDSLN